MTSRDFEDIALDLIEDLNLAGVLAKEGLSERNEAKALIISSLKEVYQEAETAYQDGWDDGHAEGYMIGYEEGSEGLTRSVW